MANAKPTQTKEEVKQPVLPTDPTAAVTPEADPVAAKLAQLDDEIRKAREANDRMALKEKEMDAQMSKVKAFGELPAAERVNVAVSHTSKAQLMKAALKKQELVSIWVPLEGKEKKGTQLPVTLNGFRVNVPKGLYVKVPKQVADVVMESLNQTAEATDIPQNVDNMGEKQKEALNA